MSLGFEDAFMRITRRQVVIAVVVIVGALYLSGRLDYALYPVGLNFHTCARNGFGATFCGRDLTAYEARIHGAQRQLQETEQSITSSESAALQTITQEECQADPSAAGCP